MKALIASLIACAAAGCSPVLPSACPPWPPAGPAVAAELGRLPAAEYPATWEWMARLSVLHDQLAACR